VDQLLTAHVDEDTDLNAALRQQLVVSGTAGPGDNETELGSAAT
jgi:hypothetical protein